MELVEVKTVPTKYTTNTGEEIDSNLQCFTLVTEPNLAEKAVKNIQKKIKIAGFRQGKVPRKVVENQVGKENLYHDLITEAWNEFITRNNVLVATTNTLNNVQVNIDDSVSFTISTNTIGQVDLAIEDKYVIDITDNVINRVGQQLHSLRQSNTELVPVTNRKLIWSDIAKFSFEGKLAGEAEINPGLSGQDMEVVIGNHTIVIPEIEQGLVDMAIDEVKEINCNLPENLGEILPKNPAAVKHAGKEVNFTVTLHGIKERKLPTDEELAQKMEKASYKELYEGFVTEAITETKADNALVIDKLIKQIILDNEPSLSKEVTPIVLDHRLNMFLSQYKQQLLTMEDEARQKLITSTSERIGKGVYQDIVINSLMTRFEEEIGEPTQEEIKAKLKEMGKKSSSHWAAYQECQNDRLFDVLNKFVDVLFDEQNEKYRKIVDAIPSTTEKIEEIIDKEATAEATVEESK